MLKIFLMIAAAALAAGDGFSQPPSGANGEKTCSFSEIFRKDGWTIPGLPAKQAGKYVRKPVTEKMSDVFATMLTPVKPETTLTKIWCAHDQGGRLQIDEEPIGIIWLLSYDFEGRIFAYGVRYVEQWIKDGIRRQLGAESQVIFYDLDGSGRFTLMKGPGGPLIPDFIPDWVKKGADLTPSK
jgi:hypothetical protein